MINYNIKFHITKFADEQLVAIFNLKKIAFNLAE